MEEKTIKVYDFEELQEDIQEKVLNSFRENNDFYFLEEDLTEHLEEELQKHKIKAVDKPKLRYSLSYCQGDGLSFVGDFEFKGIRFYLREGNLSNYYCHSNTININMEYEYNQDYDEDFTEELQELKEKENEKIEEEFTEIFHNICKTLEKVGYEHIEYENSEENIKDYIEANEYKFLENGAIF